MSCEACGALVDELKKIFIFIFIFCDAIQFVLLKNCNIKIYEFLRCNMIFKEEKIFLVFRKVYITQHVIINVFETCPGCIFIIIIFF
jgi:hypothetical protein